ncbi:MAG: ABC transporter permease [Tumebacillaceae bacterium]
MFNLVLNENMKIYRRIRTWVMIGILLFIVLAMGVFEKKYDHYKSTSEPAWQTQMQAENTALQKQLRDPKVTGSERTQIEADLARNQYALANDIAPDQSTGMKVTLDAAALTGLLTIFATVVAGDIVSSEFTWGTIKLLLIRPKNRTKVLLAKYLSTLLFGLVLLLILFVTSYVVGGLLFGFGGAGQPNLYIDASGAPKRTPPSSCSGPDLTPAGLSCWYPIGNASAFDQERGRGGWRAGDGLCHVRLARIWSTSARG